MKETNPILRRLVSLREAYDESENPVVASMRSVTSTIGTWFDENETAQVMRLMKALDPTFNKETFERELREYIVPEVVDAYLSADQEALREWCSEAVSTVRRFTWGDAKIEILDRLIMCYGRRWSNTYDKASSAIVKSLTSVKSK